MTQPVSRDKVTKNDEITFETLTVTITLFVLERVSQDHCTQFVTKLYHLGGRESHLPVFENAFPCFCTNEVYLYNKSPWAEPRINR